MRFFAISHIIKDDRVEHSLALLLETMHFARNLQIPKLICKLR